VAQVEALVGRTESVSLADQVFAYQGESLHRIGAVAYELMDLSLPERFPDSIAVPVPDQGPAAAMSWFFHADVNGSEVSMTRWPAPWSAARDRLPGTRLLASVDDPNPRLVRGATVLIGHDESAGLGLADYPAAYITAVIHTDRMVLTLRGRGTFTAITDHLPHEFDRALIAAAVHALVFQSHQPLGSAIRIRCGPFSVHVPIAASSAPTEDPAP
jgi:hypothetical protein